MLSHKTPGRPHSVPPTVRMPRRSTGHHPLALSATAELAHCTHFAASLHTRADSGASQVCHADAARVDYPREKR